MTPEQRATRNRAIAELCGWLPPHDHPSAYTDLYTDDYGTLRHRHNKRVCDFTRSLDDCKRAEEALGVRAEVSWHRLTCHANLRKRGRTTIAAHGVGTTEAEARSAAIEAMPKPTPAN